MDTELRAFLEDRFGRLEGRMEAFEGRMDRFEQRLEAFEGRMDRFEQRLEAFEGRMDRFEQRLEALEQRMGGFEQRLHEIERETSRLGVLLESVQQQVRLVAEGHGILYGAIDRQYEEVRAELRDVRGLLKVWNELVTRRLADLEYRMREKVS
ncbi:MAG: hypothetical protein QME93_06465 [Bacillota bacterium]|nr:hypothetical protein [Bacillota bacterium]MDI7249694.1 hypothetical protein [Bacillota bacterium]